MKDVHSDAELLDRSSLLEEAVGIVDLGDAVTETKQWSSVPFVIDNYLLWGWDF